MREEGPVEHTYPVKGLWPLTSLLLMATFAAGAVLNFRAMPADVYMVVEGDKAHVLREIKGHRAWMEIEILKCQDLDLPELDFYKDPQIASHVRSGSVLRLDFDEAKHADLIGRDGCTVIAEAGPGPRDARLGMLFTIGALVQFWQFLSTVRQAVVVSDRGIWLESVLVTREVRWDECSWFDLWDQHYVVIGQASGRALRLWLGLFRQPQDLVAKIKEHLGEPTRWKQRIVRAVLTAVLLGGSGITGLFSTLVGYFVALACGVATGFFFLSFERGMSKRGTAASILGLGVFALAVAVTLSMAVWGRERTALLSTIAIFGGWFFAFYLTRVYEGMVRRIIGDDWARPARPEECLDWQAPGQ
jgi:hypothetical protein